MKLIIMSVILISSIECKWWPILRGPSDVAETGDKSTIIEPTGCDCRAGASANPLCCFKTNSEIIAIPAAESMTASFKSNVAEPTGCDCRGGASANPLCCWKINSEIIDIPASETNEATSMVAKSCPIDRPNSGDVCNFEDTCNYGTESCCIEDKMQTFNSISCKCENGNTLCFYNEQCMMAPATCDNIEISNTACGGIENCESYVTGHEICECTNFGETCVYNELADEYVMPRKCYQCKDGYLLNSFTGECQHPSDINMRRRLIVTNDYSITMIIAIIIGALIVVSIIIGVLIVFHYRQKRAEVDLLASEEPISVV